MPRAAPPHAKKPINDDDLVENYAVESLGDVSADEGVPPVSSSPAAALTLGVKRKRDGKPAAGAAGGALVPDARSRAAAGAGADATSAASAVSARDVVSTFWSAFTASTTGSRLTDEEIACPLKEEHVVVPPKEAVAWPPSVTDVSDIAAIIKASLPKWGAVFGTKTKALPRPAAAPAVIIITTSARRAADMLKPLAVFKTRIAKLFAKHLSVDEQKAILAGPPVTIAVGTANRIGKLLDMHALRLSHCTLVIVDAHPDFKRFTLLSHPNLREDLFALYRDHLHSRITSGAAKLLLY